jgi:hypothetical protein
MIKLRCISGRIDQPITLRLNKSITGDLCGLDAWMNDTKNRTMPRLRRPSSLCAERHR